MWIQLLGVFGLTFQPKFTAVQPPSGFTSGGTRPDRGGGGLAFVVKPSFVTTTACGTSTGHGGPDREGTFH